MGISYVIQIYIILKGKWGNGAFGAFIFGRLFLEEKESAWSDDCGGRIDKKSREKCWRKVGKLLEDDWYAL